MHILPIYIDKCFNPRSNPIARLLSSRWMFLGTVAVLGITLLVSLYHLQDSSRQLSAAQAQQRDLGIRIQNFQTLPFKVLELGANSTTGERVLVVAAKEFSTKVDEYCSKKEHVLKSKVERLKQQTKREKEGLVEADKLRKQQDEEFATAWAAKEETQENLAHAQQERRRVAEELAAVKKESQQLLADLTRTEAELAGVQEQRKKKKAWLRV